MKKPEIKLSNKSDTEILVKGADWEFTLDVTSGQPSMMTGPEGMCEIIEIGDHTLLLTAAEHWKAVQKINPQIHLIDPNGKIKWSLPWTIQNPIKMFHENFVILRYCTPYPAHQDPMMELCIVNPDNGQIKNTYPIRVPENLLSLYNGGELYDIRATWEDNNIKIAPSFSISSGIKWKSGEFHWPLPIRL